MADQRYTNAKKQEKKTRKSLCRIGQHRVWRNQIAVQHGKYQGICGRCVGRQTQRHPGESIHIASYWTRDWPAAAVGDVGQRRTWATACAVRGHYGGGAALSLLSDKTRL